MLSFDDFPVVYLAIGYVLAAVMALLAVGKNSNNREFLFLSVSGLLVILMRVPIVIFNQEINPDESQMIAHAITLWHYPVYWQSVDGTTIGPLDNYALLLPAFFGRAFDYTSARLIGLLCVLGSLWFFYQSVKNFFEGSVARLALLPPLFLVAFTQEADFVHYSSEQLPVFLLNLGLWLLSKVKSQSDLCSNYKPKRALQGLFWLGFVLGMSPFAKIQAVPQAAVLGLFAWVFSFRPNQLWQNTAALVGGGLVFPLLTIAWAAIYGVLDDFWDFYVLGNLIYAGGSSLTEAVLRIPAFFAKSADFMAFLISMIAVALAAASISGKLLSDKKQISLKIKLFAALWLVASLYAATKSGNDFVHYLNFCIYPFALTGVAFFRSWANTGRLSWLPAFLSLLPFAALFGFKVVKHQPLNRYVSTADHRVPQSGVAELIRQYAESNERLVVWGWMCRYHVETGMPQGTAENHSERCIYPHPMREKYYRRYLNDLAANRPKIFVDTVPNSLWLNDRATQAHEAFPELKAFIAQNYRLVGEIDRTRVYVRKAEQ
ncbi:MAG: hypothetical protein U0X91_24890 [Spirosomataceae bacterium]